jgi:hypothetical protein
LAPLSKEPGAKRFRVWIGPLELKPANTKRASKPGKMDPNSDQFMGTVTGLPSGLVLNTNSSLKYADGGVADVVNGVYNHHLMFVDMSKMGTSPIKCQGAGSTAPNMGMLMGASEANRDLQFSVPDSEVLTGFKLGKNDIIMLNGELVNYTNQTKQIYAVSDMEIIETVPAQALDASMQIFNIDQCLGKAEPMPTNKIKWSLQSGKATISQEGYLMYRRGHMHDGGVNVDFKLNGKSICNSKAIYGGADQTTIIDGKAWATISRMESCSSPIKVVKGDVIDISANFDLEKYPARKHSHGSGMGENMGLVTFIFAPAPKK